MSDTRRNLARALLAKDPDWEYGSILPIATTKGKIRPAIPDILRDPMISWMNIQDSWFDDQPMTAESTEEMMPDVLNVMPAAGMATTGARLARPAVAPVPLTDAEWVERIRAASRALDTEASPKHLMGWENADIGLPLGVPDSRASSYFGDPFYDFKWDAKPTHKAKPTLHEASSYPALAAALLGLDKEDRR